MKDPYFPHKLVFELYSYENHLELTKKEKKKSEPLRTIYFITRTTHGMCLLIFLFLLFPTKKMFDSLDKMFENENEPPRVWSSGTWVILVRLGSKFETHDRKLIELLAWVPLAYFWQG